jgi:hypothetical protein
VGARLDAPAPPHFLLKGLLRPGVRQPQVDRGRHGIHERREIQDALRSPDLEDQVPERRHRDRSGHRDPAQPRVRPHEPFFLGRVRHREAVLRDGMHLGQHQQDQRPREDLPRPEARRRHDGGDGSAGRRGERDRTPRARAIEERNEERAREGERQHREQQVERHAGLRLVGRQREEHGVGEGDRQQRVSGNRCHVAEAVRVERSLRAPHPPERGHDPPTRPDEAQQRDLPGGDAVRLLRLDAHAPAGQPDRRSRKSSCTSFGLAVPPELLMT